jgi:hypothetical protein
MGWQPAIAGNFAVPRAKCYAASNCSAIILPVNKFQMTSRREKVAKKQLAVVNL